MYYKIDTPCYKYTLGFFYSKVHQCSLYNKLNYFVDQIYGWEPEFYNDSKNLPPDMPADLKEYIANITKPEEVRRIFCMLWVLFLTSNKEI